MRRNSRKKNSIKIFIAVTICAATIFIFTSYFSNQDEGIIVAKINGQKIFKSDIERKLRNVFDGQSPEIKIPSIENLPKEVIEILVKEIYFDKQLVKKAEHSKLFKDEEIKGRITDAKDRILRQAYIDSVLKSEITDQKINDKYAELNNEIAGKKEYKISHIVVKTKEEAEKILNELKSKKSTESKFSELAKKYSIDQESSQSGGDLGYIIEDNIMKEIASQITDLKQNEVSNPIETKFGWHLIKISDIRDAKQLPFESIKDNIRNQLIQEKISEINSSIIKDAKIEILIPTKVTEPKASQEIDSQSSDSNISSENKVEEKPLDQQEPSSSSASDNMPQVELSTEESLENSNQLDNKKDSHIKQNDTKAKERKQKE